MHGTGLHIDPSATTSPSPLFSLHTQRDGINTETCSASETGGPPWKHPSINTAFLPFQKTSCPRLSSVCFRLLCWRFLGCFGVGPTFCGKRISQIITVCPLFRPSATKLVQLITETGQVPFGIFGIFTVLLFCICFHFQGSPLKVFMWTLVYGQVLKKRSIWRRLDLPTRTSSDALAFSLSKWLKKYSMTLRLSMIVCRSRPGK